MSGGVRLRLSRLGASLLGVVVVATLLSGCGSGGYRVVATFDDVGDIQRRGPVEVADVRVGQISSIRLTSEFKARVTMQINSGVRIPRASLAIVRTSSLLGEKFIELRPTGAPDRGPFLADGDTIDRADTEEAPELEFVAQDAVNLLGAVSANDVATLIQTGAEGFANQGPALRALIGDLATISATLASRSSQITAVIDNLDRATRIVAGGTDDVRALLTNLAATTQILADNRDRALRALSQLSRLARVQNEVLDRYHADIDRQIKQVDAILTVAATQTQQVGTLVDFLDRFVYALPRAIPREFTQVYMWAVPCLQDPRSPPGCP